MEKRWQALTFMDLFGGSWSVIFFCKKNPCKYTSEISTRFFWVTFLGVLSNLFRGYVTSIWVIKRSLGRSWKITFAKYDLSVVSGCNSECRSICTRQERGSRLWIFSGTLWMSHCRWIVWFAMACGWPLYVYIYIHHSESRWRNSQGAMINQFMGVASHLLSRWYTYKYTKLY